MQPVFPVSYLNKLYWTRDLRILSPLDAPSPPPWPGFNAFCGLLNSQPPCLTNIYFSIEKNWPPPPFLRLSCSPPWTYAHKTGPILPAKRPSMTMPSLETIGRMVWASITHTLSHWHKLLILKIMSLMRIIGLLTLQSMLQRVRLTYCHWSYVIFVFHY